LKSSNELLFKPNDTSTKKFDEQIQNMINNTSNVKGCNVKSEIRTFQKEYPTWGKRLVARAWLLASKYTSLKNRYETQNWLTFLFPFKMIVPEDPDTGEKKFENRYWEMVNPKNILDFDIEVMPVQSVEFIKIDVVI
jgi:hypothetical protein